MPIRLVNLEGLNIHILTSYQLWFSKKKYLKNAKIPCKIGTSQDLAIFAKSRIWFSTECHNFQFAAIFGLSDWLNWLIWVQFFFFWSLHYFMFQKANEYAMYIRMLYSIQIHLCAIATISAENTLVGHFSARFLSYVYILTYLPMYMHMIRRPFLWCF